MSLSVAAFTMARNEDTFLPIWVRHYGDALGRNVIHKWFEEPPYTPALGVLMQRRFASFDPAYCKQPIHREPAIWMPGFHDTNRPVSTGVGLYLFHLRALDYATSRRRVRRLSDRQWAKSSIKKQLSNHLRKSEDGYLAEFYPQDPEPFRVALPEREFNGHIAKVAALRGNGAGMATPELRALAAPLLNIPTRFLSAVAPVAAPDTRPDYGPCRVTGVTPTELHRRAAKRVIESGIGYS